MCIQIVMQYTISLNIFFLHEDGISCFGLIYLAKPIQSWLHNSNKEIIIIFFNLDVFKIARPHGTFLAVILTYIASSLLHVSCLKLDISTLYVISNVTVMNGSIFLIYSCYIVQNNSLSPPSLSLSLSLTHTHTVRPV